MTKRTMGKEQQMESEGGATRVGVVAVRYLGIGDRGCGLLSKQYRVGGVCAVEYPTCVGVLTTLSFLPN